LWQQSAFVRVGGILLKRVAHRPQREAPAQSPEQQGRRWPPLRIVSEKQQRRSGQQTTDKKHCPFSCSKRQQPAVVHHVADHCQYPCPRICRKNQSAPESKWRDHNQRPRKKLSPGGNTDLKKNPGSVRSRRTLSPAGHTHQKTLRPWHVGRQWLRDVSTNLQ
jgi:hypothetical protein